MGEVYKARDTRLERTVAVKVLPEHLSSSAELRQRFEREAKTISQLSHPHICALYDVGNQDGVEYLVMEYLEGETLAELAERRRHCARRSRPPLSGLPSRRAAFCIRGAQRRPGKDQHHVSDHVGFYDLYERPASGGAEKILVRTKHDKILPTVSTCSLCRTVQSVRPRSGAARCKSGIEAARSSSTLPEREC